MYAPTQLLSGPSAVSDNWQGLIYRQMTVMWCSCRCGRLATYALEHGCCQAGVLRYKI